MGYKGLVMDIDGTLYNSAKCITEATRQAIFRARDAGIIIAIASGRPIAGIDDVCRRLEFAEKGGFVMGWNGGVVIDISTNWKNDMLCGDADAQALTDAGISYSPVPGGVGPVTLAVLLENIILSGERKI